MRLLITSNGIWLSGAQISVNEFVKLLKNRVEIRVLTCFRGKYSASLRDVQVHKLSCKNIGVLLDMHLDNKAEKFIEWADVVWIATGEFTIASKVKRVKRIPVIASLHSYELLCPSMWLSYAINEVCNDNCSPLKIIGCRLRACLNMVKSNVASPLRGLIRTSLNTLITPLYFYYWKKLMKTSIDSIDSFIAVSKALQNIYSNYLPEFQNKSSIVIYNPVIEPLRYVKPDPSEPYEDYILYASGSNPVKGPHVLLEAWSTVSKELRGLKLYMIGCKNSWVEKYAKRMGLNNVVFLYKLPPSNLYNMMYKARAVVMPSIWPEAFGRIPVEANRLGVPAVVSNRGALPEIIEDGVTGFVTRIDSYELANVIVDVVSSDWERSKIIENVSRRINPINGINTLLKFFEKVAYEA